MNTIYQVNGFEDRDDYLASLAEASGVDKQTVVSLAEMHGEGEDFGQLVEDLSLMQEYTENFGA